MIRVELQARVRPTEIPERVAEAIRTVFPSAEIALEARREAGEREREWIGTCASTDRLAEMVRAQRIPDTARSVLLRGTQDASTRAATTFLLGKQAALAGRVAFGVEPSPLGEIEVRLTAADERELLFAIYAIGFDTTVPAELSKIPPAYRPDESFDGDEGPAAGESTEPRTRKGHAP